MLIALAVGLGSIDMPIPQVATWEWVSWKFPKAVRAGDTIFARWTLTQKRPPVHGSKTGIAVWRVDVHTADGAMAAEGEIGAAIVRRGGTPAERPAAEAPGPPRRRRRGRRGSGQGEVATAPAAAPQPVVAPVPAERAPRRRRRKRGSGSGGNGNGVNGGNGGGHASPSDAGAPAELPPPAIPAPAPAPSEPRAARIGADGNPISRVMKRLRRS